MVLEEVAKMAYYTELMSPDNIMDKVLMNKHFSRKHGKMHTMVKNDYLEVNYARVFKR